MDVDLKTYLLGDTLVKVGVARTVSSLETHSPFLDVEVIELSKSLPGEARGARNCVEVGLRESLRGGVPALSLRPTQAGV
jgi:hypothetical protein